MKYILFVWALTHAPVSLSAESALPPVQRATSSPAEQSCKDSVVVFFGKHEQTRDRQLKGNNSPELIGKLPLPPAKRRARRVHASVHPDTPVPAASGAPHVAVPAAKALGAGTFV